MSISFDGIASGLNTSEIIQQLLAIERRPILQMQKRVETYEARMNAWRDVNMRLSGLENILSDLLLTSTYTAQKVTSSAPEVATAKATGAVPGTYVIEVERLARAERWVGERFFSATDPLGFEASFTVNGVEIEVGPEDTLQQIAKLLNEAEAGVRATVIDNRLVIESAQAGVAIAWDGAEAFLEGLGLTKQQDAQPARFIVNGIVIDGQPSNTVDVVEGMTITLLAEGASVRIQVEDDVDAVVKKFKEFVDQLNSVMDFIGSRLAKDGVLQGDAALLRLQSNLRLTLMDRVETGGSLTTLGALGFSFTREGRFELDEEKLRAALQEDPLAVHRLFAAEGEGAAAGAARRARDLIRSYTRSDGIIAGRREMYAEQIASTRSGIERLEERLERQEERLYRQFIAMEQALSALQTQSAWLQTQLVQLTAFNVGRS